MSLAPEPPLVFARCPQCHGRFVPRPGPCPRCGADEVRPSPANPEGVVRASTSLESPAAGWPTPHLLALVECSDGVHLLAAVVGELPPIGAKVRVWRDADVYRCELARGNAAAQG